MNHIWKVVVKSLALYISISLSGCVLYYANILPTEGINSKSTKVDKILNKDSRESQAQQEMQNQQQQMQSIMNQQLIKNKK